MTLRQTIPKRPTRRESKGRSFCISLWGLMAAPIIIRIDRPLGYGLDEEAIKAVQKWKFVPATNNGVPVAVAVNLEVTFHYPDPPP